MRRKQYISGKKDEQGLIITLVAVFMLGVIGAMAALSIDVVTIYTARSEAQLAADAAALAAARVIANSGATSADTTGAFLTTIEGGPAQAIALQVAEQNQIAGSTVTAGQTTVTFGGTNLPTNPTVTVRIQDNNLPTFFARIWGTKQLTVAATATAEAYNPSPPLGSARDSNPPVTPICVKPWLLPNRDPTQTSATGPQIFDSMGGIVNPSLVGKGWPNPGPAPNNRTGLHARAYGATPMPGRYYVGAVDSTDFVEPTQSLPTCSTGFSAYQLAVAACVPQPISCGTTATINLDPSKTNATSTNLETLPAVECLIHYNGAAGDSDSIDTAALPSTSFPFFGGNENPAAGAVGKDISVSDSLVTIPVYNSGAGAPPTTVTVIGFLQVFLNPDPATTLPMTGTAGSPQIPVTIINMVGCTGATLPPIIGNGASPVAVRLISP